MTEDQWQAMNDGLWRRSDVESAAVLLADQLSGGGGVVYAVREVIVVPDDAYEKREADLLRLSAAWMNGLVARARLAALSVLSVHTHPKHGRAGFSWADDAGDERLVPAIHRRIPAVNHGAVNVTKTDATARVWVGGEVTACGLAVAGRALQRFPVSEASVPEDEFHRQVLALGRHGQAQLRQLRIGVVGLGGTGSIVNLLVAHLGVLSLLHQDGDLLEVTNAPRVVGTRYADRHTSVTKVAIAARLAREARPDITVVGIDQMLDTAEQALDLVHCDVIFSCVDRLAPRAILNRLAYDAHIPVIDMGSGFRVDERGTIVAQGGKVSVIGPGRPCLWCWGDLDADRVREEGLPSEERARLEAEGYIQGADEPQPAVVAFNSLLASAAVIEMLRIVTGFSSGGAGVDRLNFDFCSGTMRPARARRGAGCRFCGVTGDDPGDRKATEWRVGVTAA